MTRIIILEHEGKTFPEREKYGWNLPYGTGNIAQYPDDRDISAYIRERQNWLAPFGHPRVNSTVRVTLK